MANAVDTAANFGYSMSFFNSDPELKALLQKAVTGNWVPSKFVAMLQSTKWFKRNGEAARQVIALKTSDPATYHQRLSSAGAQVAGIARQLGSAIDSAHMSQVAQHALMWGWTDQQIKDALGTYVKADKNGVFRGGAGTAQRQLQELAGSYGVTLSANQLGGWVRGMVQGATSLESVRSALINQTASKFPGLKERLMAGETLDDIASPYKDSYSRILEINPKTIKLSDPLLQKALATKDQKGKPSTSTVWQFENDLRSDPRWLGTKNAQDQLVGETHKALQSFGLLN